MVLSAPIVGTIYADKWVFAPFFLTLYVSGELFVLLGSVSYIKLLVATGETKMLIKLNALKLCIGIPLALLLIPPLGVLGVIIVGFVAGIPIMVIGIYWTWKHFGTKANFRNSAKILVASTIAGITTYLFLTIFASNTWIMLTIGTILFLGLYLISAPLVGAINQKDVDNLRVMFSGLGIASRLLEIPLTLIEKTLKIKTKYS